MERTILDNGYVTVKVTLDPYNQPWPKEKHPRVGCYLKIFGTEEAHYGLDWVLKRLETILKFPTPRVGDWFWAKLGAAQDKAVEELEKEFNNRNLVEIGSSEDRGLKEILEETFLQEFPKKDNEDYIERWSFSVESSTPELHRRKKCYFDGEGYWEDEWKTSEETFDIFWSYSHRE